MNNAEISSDVVAMPTNTCVYDRYDPDTLLPLNVETRIRLQELGWDSETFRDRTVLDIGCNSGLLTMYALRLGAAHVHACDVQSELAEFVRAAAESRSLPVSVSTEPFHKLDPETRAADVVLFMEVLHWIVSQGMPLRAAIQHLSMLTKETVYLECPWSVAEPSIAAQTKLTEKIYSADAIIDELTRLFLDVRIVRFMHYFGYDSGSKRVLIRATGRRPEAELLAALPDTSSLDHSLSRGRNHSYLLMSRQGLCVGKVLAPASALGRLPQSLRTTLFDRLRETKPVTLVAPLPILDDYVLKGRGGLVFMLFAFVGCPLTKEAPCVDSTIKSLTQVFIAVRRDFRRLGDDLIMGLVSAGLRVDTRRILNRLAQWEDDDELASLPIASLIEMLDLPQGGKQFLDSLNHRDLQLGNLVSDADGSTRVVDLDNLTVGTIYSDGLLGLIWRGASSGDFHWFCEQLGCEEKRPVRRADISIAVAGALEWLRAIRPYRDQPQVRAQIEHCISGVNAAVVLHRSLTH